MNILFLIFHGFSDASGISKKIFAQVNGLRAAGHQVAMVFYQPLSNGHRVYMTEDRIIQDYGIGKLASLKKRICYRRLVKYIQSSNIEIMYIRSFHNANPFMIRFIQKVRKEGIKCVMEIPTYPYDQEYEGFPFLKRMGLKIDRIFRKQLAKELNAIVTFTDEKEIFGCRTIRISNGVDFKKLPIKHLNDTSKKFRLLGVAEVHYWHGYDRLIKGLGEYYRLPYTKEVVFHIVGGIGPSEMYNSEKAPGFAELIKEYNLAGKIIFHGQKFGEELNEIFNQCDMAIGSLARHRCGIDKIRTLKNREYAARGIPFIYSETDEDFDTKPYVLKIPADNSYINIQEMIDFYENLSISPEEIRNSITHLSWKYQMEKVINELNEL